MKFYILVSHARYSSIRYQTRTRQSFIYLLCILDDEKESAELRDDLNAVPNYGTDNTNIKEIQLRIWRCTMGLIAKKKFLFNGSSIVDTYIVTHGAVSTLFSFNGKEDHTHLYNTVWTLLCPTVHVLLAFKRFLLLIYLAYYTKNLSIRECFGRNKIFNHEFIIFQCNFPRCSDIYLEKYQKIFSLT